MDGLMTVTVLFLGMGGSCVKPVCGATAKGVYNAVFNVVFLEIQQSLSSSHPFPKYNWMVPTLHG
jgi:hypothetical protein